MGRMSRDDFDPMMLAILGGIGVALYVWKNGVAGAARNAGGALVDAAAGAFEGGVSSAGNVFGLPSYDQVTNDPHVARWILDSPNGGYMAVSMYATPISTAQALQLPKGSGTPPPAGTKIAQLFPPYAVDVGGQGGSFEDYVGNDTSGIGPKIWD